MSILEQSPSSTVEIDHPPTDWLRSLPAPGIIGVGVVAAVAFNPAIWVVVALAGGSFVLPDVGKATTVAPGGVIVFTRSEESRVGTEWGSRGSSRGSPEH